MPALHVKRRGMADRALLFALAPRLEPPTHRPAWGVKQEHLVVIAAAGHQLLLRPVGGGGMGVAFGHVLPYLLAVLQLECNDAAALPLDCEFQPDKEQTKFGRQCRRRAYPVRSDKAPHFRTTFRVEAINIPVIAAKIDLAAVERRGRPEILMSLGIDSELPRHRSVGRIEAPEGAAVAAEVNTLAVRGRKGFWNAMEEIRVGRGEIPCVSEHGLKRRFRVFDRKAEFGEAERRTNGYPVPVPPSLAFRAVVIDQHEGELDRSLLPFENHANFFQAVSRIEDIVD